MNVSHLLKARHRRAGLSLHEIGDDVLVLRRGEDDVAMFGQNILLPAVWAEADSWCETNGPRGAEANAGRRRGSKSEQLPAAPIVAQGRQTNNGR